jgi:alpha-tubulin suppressor-like RCC1 family protein
MYRASLFAVGGVCLNAVFVSAVLFSIPQNVKGDSAVAWGNNIDGQIGDGAGPTARFAPAAVVGMASGVTSVAAGVDQSLAIQNGSVYSWGSNQYGELGDGTTTERDTPVPVTGLPLGVTSIAGGSSFSLAIQNGNVYAWGNNQDGELGDGTGFQRNTPVLVTGLNSATAIAAGGLHSVAIQNGSVYAWGYNLDGELGNGTTTQYYTPVAVTGLTSGVTAIAVGYRHCLAVQNGALYAWGANNLGQLGDNDAEFNATTPVSVSGLSSGVTAIAAGENHSLAVQNGNVYAWGDNSDGQIGDGTGTRRLTPEQIDPTDLHNIIAVAAGAFTSYALSSDGSIWDWGEAGYGNLGLGFTNTIDYFTPQHLLPPTGYVFTSINAGAVGEHAVATLAPVPEPSTFVLAVLASGLVVWKRFN